MHTLESIATVLQGTLTGNPQYMISGVSAIQDASPSDITFLLNKKYLETLSESRAGALVTPIMIPGVSNQVLVSNPRKALAEVLSLFFPAFYGYTEPSTMLHAASIDPTAQIAHNTTLGAFTVVGPHTSISEGTRISNSVSIGARCRIGKNCVIYPQVVLYDGVVLGDNVIVHSGCVIGSDGFGYYPDKENWEKILQVGSVVIENDVEIGANTCLDRGCLGPTHIGKGTKIDNLVHIAHNSNIGQNCILTGQVGLMGSAILEDHVTVGGQSGISAIRVGKNTTIAGRSGVTKDCAPDSVLSGFPAWAHKDELKKEAFLRKMVQSKKKEG